ncbi:uncharacterized protein Z520_08808 [Fonsecaea multimorphosa CBS 102226]|uniref:Uncharacterized protein n=1 Tax=Fonsecaea multimorphosa CBS 102226 TaxID=1442371 RepID=A0A0D2IDS7_9EURO|nr:uncharacterized protein Z520_08808 [Fonsecaea multimorphosa CBS 102226]KIX95291.1 hypothetical protein Z520_08808 [Fonsecaea multimorphosa CBS 102226]
MSQLPLQIRKDIRDLFDEADSAVQNSFVRLAKITGYQVSCTPEWHMLWAELRPTWREMTTFVPTIAKLIEVWCHTLGKRLEDARFEAWTEELLEKLKNVYVVKVSIQVTADESRVRTAWLEPHSYSFTISLPQNTQLQQTMVQTASSAFSEDFESMFEQTNHGPTKPLSTSRQQEVNGQQNPTREDEEEWAELESVADTTKSTGVSIIAAPKGVPHHSARLEPDADVFPALEALPRPEILFRTTTPYVMLVSSNGPNKITVSGTHEPSLQLLAEYLRRWIKTDPRNILKKPSLCITLNESNIGLGLFYDSLTIEPFEGILRPAVVNVSLILAFIQGILGYQRVHETSGPGQWEFSRVTPFAA